MIKFYLLLKKIVETIYNSINEAAIKNNVSASAIYNCLYRKI